MTEPIWSVRQYIVPPWKIRPCDAAFRRNCLTTYDDNLSLVHVERILTGAVSEAVELIAFMTVARVVADVVDTVVIAWRLSLAFVHICANTSTSLAWPQGCTTSYSDRRLQRIKHVAHSSKTRWKVLWVSTTPRESKIWGFCRQHLATLLPHPLLEI